MKKIVLLGLFSLFCCSRSFAGPCPSDSSYYNLSHQLVALTDASIGILQCYYVAPSSCVDTNAGTKASPWCHAPGMPKFTGSHTLTKGDAYLFQGGGTWHFGNSALTPYTGGAWVTNAVYGSATNEIYFGVDHSFFIGAAWTRPILTEDNALNVNQIGSCAFDMGGLTGRAMVTIGDYQIFDNFEMTGLCANPNGTVSTSATTFYIHGIHNTLNHAMMTNSYLHGESSSCVWGTTVNSPPGSVTSCHDNCQIDFVGSISYVWNNVFDFSDSYAGMLGWGSSDAPEDIFAYNYVNYMGQGIPGFSNVVHDNLFENFTTTMHANVYETFTYATTTGAFYNNVIRNSCANAAIIPGAVHSGCAFGTVFIGDFPPTAGTKKWYFNNVFYGISTQIGNYFALSGHSGQTTGTIDAFNNTMENFDNGVMFTCLSGSTSSGSLTNNYEVDDVAPYSLTGGLVNNCSSPGIAPLTEHNDTHANSSTNTSSGVFQYFPTSGGALVGTGTNNQAKCTAISNSVAANPALSDAVTACPSDTTYGITYVKSNHTVSWPARTPHLRPTSGNWNIGAYEFNPSVAPPILNPPSIVFGTIQQGTASGGLGAIISTDPGAGITFTGPPGGVSFSGTNASDFSSTTTCGATLAASSACNYTVTFSPSATVGVAESATMNVSYTGEPGSPLTIALTGTSGAHPSVGPALLFYGEVLSDCAVCPSSCLCVTREPAIYSSSGGVYSYFWKPVMIP